MFVAKLWDDLLCSRGSRYRVPDSSKIICYVLLCIVCTLGGPGT